MDKQTALDICAELEALWRGDPVIMGKIGRAKFKFNLSGWRYSKTADNITGTLEIIELANTVGIEQSFKANAGQRDDVDLGPNDLGRVFQYCGIKYTVIGWNEKAPKYPVIVKYTHTLFDKYTAPRRFPLVYMPRPGAFIDDFGLVRGPTGGFSAWVDSQQPIAPDSTDYRREDEGAELGLVGGLEAILAALEVNHELP